MPSAQFRRYEAWTQQLHAGVIGRANLTVVAPTGTAHVVLSSLALSLDELSFNAGNVKLLFDIDTAAGPDLDARAAQIVPGTLARLPAQPAAVLLTFSRAAAAGAVLVGEGTEIKDQNGVAYATLADATLPDGALALPNVAAQAVLPGLDSAVGAHALSAFTTKPVGIDNVDNPAPSFGGSNQENDDSFRQRARLYVASLSRGTEQAFVYGMLGATDPDSGDVVQHAGIYLYPNRSNYVEIYVADAAGTNQGRSVALTTPEVLTAGLMGPGNTAAVGGETRLPLKHIAIDAEAARQLTSSSRGTLAEGTQYNLDAGAGVAYFDPALSAGETIQATYSYFTGLLSVCQKIVNGDRSNWDAFPGLALATQMVRVRSPQLSLIEATAALLSDPNYDRADIESQAQAAIGGYLSGLGIGEPVIRSRLVAAVMAIAGVTNVVFSKPSADLIVAQNQIARPGVVTVS